MPVQHFVLIGEKYVLPSHTGMAVGGEIEVAVGSYVRKEFVAGCVYLRAEVFYLGQIVERHPPYIFAAVSSRHVGYEIEPLCTGFYGRVCKYRHGIYPYLYFFALMPCCVGTLRCVYGD